MRIPLFNRLKKRVHVETAMLQDELADVVYSVSPKAVLHGGTAVWRCYSGNRFSEDLDFYLSETENFKQAFAKALDSRNLTLLKFKKTENNVFSRISNGIVEVRLEAAFRMPKSFEVRQFEKVDGSFLNVFTLSPEKLVLEKIQAYSNRRLIRDFYDVFMLSSISSLQKIGSQVRKFLEKVEKPVDEKTLQTIVFSGAVPSFEQMLVVLKRRFKQ